MKFFYGLLVCVVSFGCSSEEKPLEHVQAPKPVNETLEKDDSAAIDALSQIGASTTKNADGLVIEVNLRETKATDETLKAIASLQHVRVLLLNDLEITDAGLEVFNDVNWPLVNLDLRGCPVSNKGLTQLTGISSLKALRLSGSNSRTFIDDDGMDAIAGLENLKVLSLDKLWITNTGIERLLPLVQLEELYLAETTIDDDALVLLAKFQNLRKLRLSKNQISNSGLKHLAGLDHLVELDLSEISLLSDDGMLHLSGLTRLQKLNLWRVPVSDAGVRHLKPLINMKWLNLDNTRLSDDGLQALVNMTKISFLHLGSTQVSDSGLAYLSGLTSLRDLKVTRTSVSAAGVTDLQKSLPETEIQLKYLAH
ncbi:MAG: hypothetical protein MK102_01000 [Fuerstiella sp.]|nr:hypothetical protein [Fuerstiella sp.]